MKWILLPLIAFLAALVPSLAFAAEGEDDDVLIRIGGDVVVARGETIGTVVVVDGNAVIEGTVTQNVVVVNGRSVVSGKIEGELVVVSGTIDLRSGATVFNVHSIDTELIRASGATVTGEVNVSNDVVFFSGVAGALSFLFWGAMTFAVLAAGLLFAAVGGRQLTESARAVTGSPLNTLIGAVAVWVGIPALAVAAMVTVIGIPFGIGLLIFLLPTLWFLGYIVAGSALGAIIVGLWRNEPSAHPYLATFVGLILLQVGIFVPVIGALIAWLAGLWGAGALAYVAYRGARGQGITPSGTTTHVMGQTEPAA